MPRILERHDDFRPLYKAIMADPPNEDLLAMYHGTELVNCWGDEKTCTRAVVARGPLDIDLTLELVDDEGWVYASGKHFCPQHRDEAV